MDHHDRGDAIDREAADPFKPTGDPERDAERAATVGGFVGAVLGARGGPVGAGIGAFLGGSTGYAVGYVSSELERADRESGRDMETAGDPDEEGQTEPVDEDDGPVTIDIECEGNDGEADEGDHEADEADHEADEADHEADEGDTGGETESDDADGSTGE